MKSCCICQAPITVEEPPILIMSAYGEPRCLCEDCSAELDTVTLGKELDAIAAAMDGIGKKMSESDPDKLTFNTVNKIMQKGAERAKAIREGSYDFALDGEAEENGEGFDEIPEELAETEEDKELDRRDEEKAKKINQFLDWVTVGALIGAVGFFIWKLVERFFLS